MELSAELGFFFDYDVPPSEDFFARLVDTDAVKTTFTAQLDSNPILCLRSKFIYKHSPACTSYSPGKEHLMDLNVKHGLFFVNDVAPEEDFCADTDAVLTTFTGQLDSLMAQLPWFASNLILCLRSQYMYKHNPACTFYSPGKDHLLDLSKELGLFFDNGVAPAEDFYAKLVDTVAVKTTFTGQLDSLMALLAWFVELGARALQGLQERLAMPSDAAGVDRERLMLAESDKIATTQFGCAQERTGAHRSARERTGAHRSAQERT